jgi:hypothetical protein
MHRPDTRQTVERFVGSAGEAPSPRVYFARAIDGEDSATRLALASDVASELAAAGLLMVDPTVDDPTGASATEAGTGKLYQVIVEHDLSVLKSCHAILMDISVPGRSYIGCICEMTYAYFWRIPCVVYVGKTDSRRPWLHYHATAVFETRADAIDLLGRLLKASPAPGASDNNVIDQ